MSEIITAAETLGVPVVVLAIVIYLLLQRDKVFAGLQSELTQVVQNNTEALTRLCDSTAETNTTLDQHDQRAQRIEGQVTQIARVTDRIEQKVDALQPSAGRIAKGMS